MARTEITKEVFLDKVRQVYRDWGTMERRIPNFHLITRYVRGEQSTDKYRKLLSVDEHDGNSRAAINWRPVSVIDPVQRIAAARIMRKEEHIVAVPVDSKAHDEENKYFARMKARLMLREQLLAQGGDVDLLPRLDGEPETIEELRLLMDGGMKHRLAKDYEDAVEAVMTASGVDELRDEAIAQLFNYGYAAWKHYIDSDGLLRVRLVPPGRLIAPYSLYVDWRDADAMGEEIDMTVAQIRELYPSMTAQEERQLYGRELGQRRRDSDKVRVVYMEVRGSELLSIERRPTSWGGVVTRYVRGKETSRTVRSFKVDRVYGGYWVVDTDICFGFGEVPATPRQLSTFERARFTYVARAVTMVDGTPKGLAVDAIPYVDAFHVAWYKMQQAIATMRPNALFIAVESLVGVPLRDKDRPVTASDLLNLFAEKNVLVGRMRDEAGRATSGPPVVPINTGDARIFQQLRMEMIDAYDQVRRLYGLNALTDASTPNPDTLTTIAKLADQGTSNALHFVERTDRRLMSALYQGVADRIAVTMRGGHKRMQAFLERVIGRGSVLMIKNSEPFYLYDVGITIMDAPDIEERQGLEEAMQQAVREGSLTPADIIMVRSIRDPSQAAEMLAMRVARNRRMAEEQSMRMQQMNAMVQQQSAAQAHQMKMEEMKAEADLKIYVWQNTRALELQAKTAVEGGKLQLEAAKTAIATAQQDEQATSPVQ